MNAAVKRSSTWRHCRGFVFLTLCGLWSAIGVLGPSVALAYVAVFPYTALLDPAADTDFVIWQARVDEWRVRAWGWLGVLAILAIANWRLMLWVLPMVAQRLFPSRASESEPVPNNIAADSSTND